jgi:hypothetical protein
MLSAQRRRAASPYAIMQLLSQEWSSRHRVQPLNHSNGWGLPKPAVGNPFAT